MERKIDLGYALTDLHKNKDFWKKYAGHADNEAHLMSVQENMNYFKRNGFDLDTAQVIGAMKWMLISMKED